MSEHIQLIDIAEVDQLYAKMKPIPGINGDKFREIFICNYLIRDKGDIDPIQLNMMVQSYNKRMLGTRYLIDENDPLIQEIYESLSNR